MQKTVFLPSLCLILLITSKDVTGIDLSTFYPNTVGGACMNDVATATCTVISSTLQWRVSNDQSGAEFFTRTLTANEGNIGNVIISQDNVTVFQNHTVRNITDVTQSLISSELRILLSSSLPSVTITCSDVTTSEEVHARLLDDPPPTRLSQLEVVTRSDAATVYFVWEPPLLFARSDILEYILTAIAAVDAQNQSKITTLTGSSLELSMFINYNITVQQRTKCMDVSDPATILFESMRGTEEPMQSMTTMSTVEMIPRETTTLQQKSKSDCPSSIGPIVYGSVSVVLLITVLVGILAAFLIYTIYNARKKKSFTPKPSPTHPTQEVGPG